MKAPEGFAARARREASYWISGRFASGGVCLVDVPYAYAWRYFSGGTGFDSAGHAATWWLLLAELANDGQEAPK